MRLSLVLGTVGHLLSRFALAVLPSLVVAALDGHGVEVLGFALGGAAALFFGAALGRLLEPGARLQRAENLAVVALTWLAVGLVGSVPFLAVGLTPIDAVFESVSGITTTGASVFTDFSLYGRGIFLWRAVLQWIGGLGVIALFVAILPQLGVAGRQLYFAEASSSASEPIAPRVRALSGRLWAVYTILTAAEIAILDYQGMPFFDAVCNAMATLAAGGFSPNGASIQGYGLPACEWTVAVFMFLAGANFALQWRMLTGRPLAFTQDPEFRVYAVVAALGTGLVALLLAGGLPTEAEWRQAFFQVASVMSATGFASTDYNLWVEGARACLIFLMLFGGCAGSAAGGPKVVRYMIVAKHSRREMIRTIHPQAVMPVRLGRATVSEDVLRAVVVFVLVYLLMWGCVGFLLTILGLDMVSAYSGTLACLANCGPGLNALGPMANYEGLPSISKAILVLTMWIGRLEVITVFALLRPDVLRRIRWR